MNSHAASLPGVNLAKAPPHWFWTLWWRWLLANALGEMLGLGAASLVGIGLAWQFKDANGVAAVLLLALVMVLFGTLEGVVLGWAQWLVLRRYLAELRGSAWIKATALGAFIAWLLGMLPSTIISLTAHGAGAPPAISDALQYSLAAVMGLVLGVILGLPQWLALRPQLRRAGWWVWANAIAWAVGMPVIFIGAGTLSPEHFSLAVLLLGVLLTCAVAGAVVGAVHGVALVWLLQGGGAHADAHDLS